MANTDNVSSGTNVGIAGRPHEAANYGSPRTRAGGVAAVIGGFLWIGFGVFEFLQPLGIDRVYDGDRAYDVVVDRTLFTVYSAPGAVALILTTCALLAVLPTLGPARRRSGGFARACGAVALTAALVSLVGVVVAFDPLATGMRIAGSLLLGIGTSVGAFAAAGSSQRYAALLGVLGAVGMFLLPLWPLVYAAELLSPAAGAGVIAVFGLGWVGLGLCMRMRHSAEA